MHGLPNAYTLWHETGVGADADVFPLGTYQPIPATDPTAWLQVLSGSSGPIPGTIARGAFPVSMQLELNSSGLPERAEPYQLRLLVHEGSGRPDLGYNTLPNSTQANDDHVLPVSLFINAVSSGARGLADAGIVAGCLLAVGLVMRQMRL